MTKTTNEQGFNSTVYEGKTHEDLYTCLFPCFLSQEEPKKVIQALKDPSWIEAMQEELLQFKLQQVWTLVDLPYGKRAIETKWVYKNKKDERGIVIRNKARLMDVKSAFLYGKIEEEVYVCQPPGFEDLEFPNKVYKVEKALYGLHQAPRAWYETLSTYLLDNGFQRGQIDKTLSTKKELCTDFEKLMHKKFQMSSMGELTFFLRFQVTQKNDGIFISQDKYVDEILKKFGFSTVKTASTPMETSKPLLKDAEAEDVDVHLYRSMIGSLMYLTASRPDIMFDVCACARFQITPKGSHLHAVKRIFRYLKGQPKLGLWYPKDSPFNLEAYTDSDYVGVSLDRKSTIGGCQFLGSRLISCQCKKQTIVATSTTEAEYVAAASYCRQGIISIAGTSMLDSTAGMVQEVNISIPSAVVVKDKEWENIRARVKADEELTQILQAEERNKYSELDQAKMLQLKRYSFDELKELFETTMKNVNTFIPIETKGRALELATRSSQATIIDLLHNTVMILVIGLVVSEHSVINLTLLELGFCSRGGGGGSVDLVSVVFVTLEGTSTDAVRALKICKPLMLDSYTAAMYTDSRGMASYARAILELQADVELRENILVVLMLVDDDGKPLKKVDYLVNADSDSEAEEVFNETVGFMASTSSKVYNHSKSDSGVESKSMYEQWRETYVKDRYDDKDFDDYGLIDASLKFTNAFDISLHGQLR
ncbi:putative ribonuclease H-like domain-containing protein [Tanacetum coccineum]